MENSIAARQCRERSDGHMCGSPRHAWMILAHGGAGPRPAWQRVEDAQICSRWSRYELGRAQGTSTRERSAVRSPERLRARVAHAQAVRHNFVHVVSTPWWPGAPLGLHSFLPLVRAERLKVTLLFQDCCGGSERRALSQTPTAHAYSTTRIRINATSRSLYTLLAAGADTCRACPSFDW